MRAETIKRELFTFDELSDDVKEKVLQEFRERNSREIFWQEEIFQSLKELFKNCNNITLKNYQLGGQGSHLKLEFNYDEVADFSGSRAMAWIENNLLSDLRISFTGTKRREYRKYGKYYYAGKIKPCPFTGYCADEDYLEKLIKSIKSGMTLKDSFCDLAEVYNKLVEQEEEFQTSDGYIKEEIAACEYEFTADGSIA